MKEKKNSRGAAPCGEPTQANPGSEPNNAKAKSSPRKLTPPGPNRCASSRQYRILELIQKEPGLSALEISQRVRCSRASFFRDLEYLTVDRGFPIQTSKRGDGYSLTKPVLGFASLYMTSSELLSLLLARRSLEGTRNAAVFAPLQSVMDKLSTLMTDEISQRWAQLDSLITFRSSTVEVLTDPEVALAVWDALLGSEEIELMYKRRRATTPTPRRLQPLHLLCLDSAWYLFAQDLNGEDTVPHRYLLSRMSEVQGTGKKFTPPDDFDVEELLAHSIGVYGGNDPQHFHLRMAPVAAQWFGERRLHNTQEFTTHPDGSAELTMQVAINPELQRLVMSWGSEVEVLAPPSLRESVWRNAQAVVARGPVQ